MKTGTERYWERIWFPILEENKYWYGFLYCSLWAWRWIFVGHTLIWYFSSLAYSLLKTMDGAKPGKCHFFCHLKCWYHLLYSIWHCHIAVENLKLKNQLLIIGIAVADCGIQTDLFTNADKSLMTSPLCRLLPRFIHFYCFDISSNIFICRYCMYCVLMRIDGGTV